MRLATPSSLPRLALALVLALWTGACDGAINEIELTFSASECAPEELAEVRYVTVELFGIADQQPCALARRCVPVTPQDLDGLVSALAAAPQPLIDVEDPDAHIVAVIGHRSGCLADDDHVLCGETDVANRRDGVLAVPLECGACAGGEVPFCP